ncbi:hypothetical protein [Mycolicibacterium cosmeticum]|uniref:hypothetical protein n=1 Tax=Mycolicibacterium cosmeticum TaxID=258533 RepID=UPI003204AD7D
MVTGGLWMGGSQWFLPMLRTPFRRVSGVDRDDGDSGLGGHRQQSSAQSAGRHAGDDLTESEPAAVFLTGLGVSEVEILYRNGLDSVVCRPVQQLGESVSDLRVTMSGGAVELVSESAWDADRVAVWIQPPSGEVVGVHVYPDHLTRAQRLQGHGRDSCALPGRVQIPAVSVGVVVDAVGDGTIGCCPVGPFVAAVREHHCAGEDVAVMRSVREMDHRRG